MLTAENPASIRFATGPVTSREAVQHILHYICFVVSTTSPELDDWLIYSKCVCMVEVMIATAN